MSNIREIVEEEWRQFQKVNNQGGRASCQDDWKTFYIMRKSQFLVWPQEILDSYYDDLCKAREEGRNLLFAKYAYMMESTAPEEFEKLKKVLPVISDGRKMRVDETVAAHVKWAEEFEQEHPEYARRGRPIRACQEAPGQTSIETYQRGELYSYGENTEKLYSQYVQECVAQNRNLASLIRENTTRMYGYESISDIEKRME